MEDFKRPTKQETDEDLIKQQEQFMERKNECSLPQKLNTTQGTSQDVVDKSSSFQKETISFKDDFIVQPKEVVFDVKENEVSVVTPFTFHTPTISHIKMRNLMNKKVKQSQFSARKSSKSIFAQLIEQDVDDVPNKENDVNIFPPLIDESGLSKNVKDNELKKIHEENLAKLSAMSREEIMQHKEQLEEHLDPKIIQFIKNKKISQKGQSSINVTIPSSSKKSISQTCDKEEAVKVIRKEGREDCDALILQKTLVSEQINDQLDHENLQSSINSKQKTFEIPKETMELLEESKGLWKNMNKIEKEKLEWMSELPKPNPINKKTGFTARFDFEGKLLAHDVDTPTYVGLHHHGADPDVAGYTLEELFLLARSTLQSQRITALHTIAHILDNYWHGMTDSCFEEPLLPILLQAGIVPLLRWALDDTSLTSIAATITAIHSLLICKPDEACLQRTFTWLNGHITPQVEPQDLIESDVVIEELTDADLIKLDVVKGFIRIDILPRFMYILQSMHPPPLVCKLIIEICSHLSQHSAESADYVARYPGFLKLIFEKFLPLSWQFIDGSKLLDSVNYCCPMPSAMKLLRIIAASNRELAYLLLDLGLTSHLVLYLTIEPMDNKVPMADFQLLVIETLKTIHVLLLYGLGIQVFLNLFPIFLKQMNFCLSLDLHAEKSKHFLDFDYAAHFFKVLEAVAVISTEPEHLENSLYSAINVFFQKALVCLKKWLWQLMQDNSTDHGLNLLSACLNFTSRFSQKSHKGLICEDFKPCSTAKEVFTKFLLPCIKSKVFKSLLQNLKSFSLFLCPDLSGSKRDSKTIVTLGSILWNGDIVPPLKEQSPVPLLQAILNFAIVHKSLFVDTDNKELKELLRTESITEYLKEISHKRNLNCGSWFATHESYLIFELLQLSSMISDDHLCLHKTAVALLSTLKQSHECLAEDLFENIIFNSSFLPSSNEEVIIDIIQKLPVISKCYATFFYDSDSLLLSKNLFYRGLSVNSVFFISEPTYLFSNDWVYSPILKFYQDSKQRKSSEGLSGEEILQVTSSLQWVYACHKLNLPLIENVPPALEFCFLSMVFLFDGNFFFNSDVKILLERCFRNLIKHKKINLTKVNWKSIVSYDDLYLEMLIQFEAVSYGDELFANFILFPIQQSYPIRWKKELLTEHAQMLQFLRIPLSRLLIPLDNFLEPYENNIEVVFEYFKLLVSGELSHKRCPLIYLMSIHHIHHFLFARNDDVTKSQKLLLSRVLHLKNEDVKQQILLFSEKNMDAEYGFNLKAELSPHDQEHLNFLMEKTVLMKEV